MLLHITKSYWHNSSDCKTREVKGGFLVSMAHLHQQQVNVGINSQ